MRRSSDPGVRSKYEAMGMQEESLADVESAYSSSAMYKKILRDKMRQLKERGDWKDKSRTST